MKKNSAYLSPDPSISKRISASSSNLNQISRPSSAKKPSIMISKPNDEFFKNLRSEINIQNKNSSSNKDGFLEDCQNSQGFLNLKKKYKGIRLKEKIINTQAVELDTIQKEREKEMKKFFGAKLANKLIQGNLTKEEKNKRAVKKKGTVMPQLFATEYISQRKLKELRAQQKIVMRMNLSNEKFAYSIVSQNLLDFFEKKNKNFNPTEFDFLSGKMKKNGPVANMLETFKNNFEKKVKERSLKNKNFEKKNLRSYSQNFKNNLHSIERKETVQNINKKLWNSNIGEKAKKTKEILEDKQRQKYKNKGNTNFRISKTKRKIEIKKEQKRVGSAESEKSIKSSLSITEMKLENLYEKLRIINIGINYFSAGKNYEKGDIQKRKKLSKMAKKIQKEIRNVVKQKQT